MNERAAHYRPARSRRAPRAGAALAAVAAVAASAPGTAGQCVPRWSAMPSPKLGTALALDVHDGGFGPALFVGGHLISAGGQPVNLIARWDGRVWSSLGRGLEPTSGYVRRIVDIREPGIPPGTAGLYAGGPFQEAGGLPSPGIAHWKSGRWFDVGGSLGEGSMRSMHNFSDVGGSVPDPVLYVGGSFWTAGGLGTPGLAQWDGQDWSAVPGWEIGGVRAMTITEDGSGRSLYMGGQFTSVGGITAWNIARWDGREWSGLQRGASAAVDALQVFDDGSGPSLYVGGGFPRVGEPDNWLYVWGLARWDGQRWHPVPGFDSGSVRDMLLYDDGTGSRLYIAGYLGINGQGTHVASWDGAQWTLLPALSGIGGGRAQAMAVFQDDPTGRIPPALYVGGLFTHAGGVPAPGLARWGCPHPTLGCYGDCDQNGTLDFFDFLCFQNAFLAGDPYADCDGNGTLEFFDFLCFQNEFLAGCP